MADLELTEIAWNSRPKAGSDDALSFLHASSKLDVLALFIFDRHADRMSTQQSVTERSVLFEGIANFRDLGGIETPDGRVRHGRLYRSGTLHKATAADARMLDDLGIRAVLDLRSDGESDRWPGQGAWSCPEVSRISMMNRPWEPEDVKSHSDAAGFLAARYMEMIDHRSIAIVEAIEVLAAACRMPTVVHCAAGKDRTGLLVAIVLGLLDVADEAIAADYHRSAAEMAALANLYADGDKNTMVEQPEAFLAAPPEAILEVLDTMRCVSGDVTGFVIDLGTSPEAITELRLSLVGP